MTALRCVHVVPHINDEASGPSYSVPRLCRSLVADGQRVGLMCLAAGADIPGVELERYWQWPVLKRFALSPAFARGLRRRTQEVDIVHNHSLWSMVNVIAGWIVPGSHARLVTSPRGTLSAWALGNSRWVKRALWPLQRRALARADLLHATSEGEHDEIRALGFAAPILVLPNGVDVPAQREKIGNDQRTLLFLSRIHPKKGIDALLHAWQELQQRHPQWRLVIAGRGDVQHVREIQSLASTLQLQRVSFPGPLYGDAKAQAYRDADLFVLPTHSENFGMVVAEALAHGCPAVVSRGAPWSGLDTHACGWWIDNDVTSLVAALDAALILPDTQLQAMGARGREWMLRDYSWDAIGKRMGEAYRWLLHGGVQPAQVRTR